MDLRSAGRGESCRDSAMVCAIRESRVTRPAFFRLALIGAVAASFMLSACGRKGPLDLPPRASAAGSEQIEQNEITEDADGNPIAPKGQKRRFFLDFLLN